MEVLVALLSLPLMLFGGFLLDGATNDDSARAEEDEEEEAG